MWYRFARADSFHWFLARVVLLYMFFLCIFQLQDGALAFLLAATSNYFATLVLQVKFIVLKAAYPSCDSTRAIYFTSNIAVLDSPRLRVIFYRY